MGTHVCKFGNALNHADVSDSLRMLPCTFTCCCHQQHAQHGLGTVKEGAPYHMHTRPLIADVLRMQRGEVSAEVGAGVYYEERRAMLGALWRILQVDINGPRHSSLPATWCSASLR